MKTHSWSLWIAVISLASLIGCGGGANHPNPSSAHTSISLSDANQWTEYGSSKIEIATGGFILRYAFDGINTWGSVADDFQYDPTIGHNLDCSLGCQLILTVKAVDGAQNLGVTDRFPSDSFQAVADISNGLDDTFTYWLPTSKNPFTGIALHFGRDFGNNPPLNNPPNSGILVESIEILQYTR